MFERIFTINESPGKNHEVRFSVNLRRTEENNPEIKIALIEGTNILNDPVCIVFEYESLDGSGTCSVNLLKTGLSVNPRDSNE